MKLSNPDVILGREGWLFLGAGSNDFMSYLDGRARLPSATLDAWQRLLTLRQSWFQKAGIRYLHLFAPEKVTVYPNYYPHAVNTSLGHISILSQHCAGTFLNVLHYFNEIKHKYRLYDKTDTHWNRVGAFACYQLICSTLGFKPLEDLVMGSRTRINAVFDLGAKFQPRITEAVEVVNRNRDSRRVFANVLIRFKEKNRIENEVGLHVGSRAVFRNEAARYKEKVVIFGDSFAEYRPNRLTEMFAETFTEVHFCWSGGIFFDYVRRVNPTIVISELSERFAVTIPDDSSRSVDDFARNRLLAYAHRKQDSDTKSAESPKGDRAIPPRRKSVPTLPTTGVRGPDYLIVGSMKCGTTILHDFISTHPKVVKPKQKEIHYFSLYLDKGESWYAQFFDHVSNDNLVGEASPTYLDMTSGATLPRLIRATLPDVRIIAIVKDPVDRAISHFFHLCNVDKNSAIQALDPNEVFAGDLFRKYHADFLVDPTLWSLRYVLNFGNYYEKLVAFREVFQENLLVISTQDLWEFGQATMKRVFEHIGLEVHAAANFERKAYVTPSHLKKRISESAIASLREYYRPSLEMLRRYFGIQFT